MINDSETIRINRKQLEDLIERGIKKYNEEKNQYGSARLTDCIMREIDLEEAFKGNLVEKEN